MILNPLDRNYGLGFLRPRIIEGLLMQGRRNSWPKLISLWLLVCLAAGTVPVLPTHSALVTDGVLSLVALARGQNSFQIAPREPVRVRAKLLREHKHGEAPANAPGAAPSLGLSRLSVVQSVSPFNTIAILARFGRAPPSPLL